MSTKTWAQLEGDLNETFRKWGMPAPTIENMLSRRSKAKRAQSRDERTVTIRFRWRPERPLMAPYRDVALTVTRWDTAIENLSAIARALEMVRLAKVRGLTDLLVGVYRQTHPAMPQQAPPPHSTAQIPEHYRLLHVQPTAPLAVCEAAYRALVRTAHPDVGGDTLTMQRLNGAIERVRKEKAG